MKKNEFLIYLLYLTICTLFLSCARGKEETKKKQIIVNFYVEENIDSTNCSYYITFDTDGDPADGPYITTEGKFSSTTTDHIKFDNGVFTRTHITILPNGEVLYYFYPHTQGSTSKNKITILLDPSVIGNPLKLDVNFFTIKDKQVYDGLGDPYNDNDVIHFDLRYETQRVFSDPSDELKPDPNFNITNGDITVVET